MTTAIVPFKPQRVVSAQLEKPQRVVPTKAQRRAERAAMLDRVFERGANTVFDALDSFLTFPPTMILATCAATNVLSQTQSGEYNGRPIYVIEGSISTALQTSLVAGTVITTLAQAVKPATDIVSLIKLIRTGIA